jgi:hypothetical protein
MITAIITVKCDEQFRHINNRALNRMCLHTSHELKGRLAGDRQCCQGSLQRLSEL